MKTLSNRQLGWLIFAASLITRLYFYFLIPKGEVDPVGLNGYPGVLLSHFWEYMASSTALPPVNHIIKWVILQIFGLEITDTYRGYYLITLLMDCVAVVFIFNIATMLKVNRWVSAAFAGAYSIGILSFEFWAFSGHQDHFSPFFVTLFMYFLLRFYFDTKNIWGLIISSALLVNQLPTATYFVPIAIFNVFAIQYWKTGGTLFKRQAAVAFGVAFGISILILRNFTATGLLTSSSKGGPVIMMFVQETMGWHSEKALNDIKTLMKEAQVPDWYLWCFDNIQNPVPGHDGWNYLSRCFGICMPSTKEERQVGKPWPFDFTPLISKLNEFGAHDIAKVVELDQKDVLERQYLYKGSPKEFTPRWSAYHGSVSLKVAKYFLLHRPLHYWEGIRKHHKVYGELGPYFVHRVMTDELKGGGAYKFIETASPFFAKILYKFNKKIFCPYLYYFYSLIPISLLFALALIIMSRKFELDAFAESLTFYLTTSWIVYLPAATASLLYSSTVSHENDRYFYHVIPIFVICSTTLITLLYQGVKTAVSEAGLPAFSK